MRWTQNGMQDDYDHHHEHEHEHEHDHHHVKGWGMNLPKQAMEFLH